MTRYVLQRRSIVGKKVLEVYAMHPATERSAVKLATTLSIFCWNTAQRGATEEIVVLADGIEIFVR
jgi:hypothetical protein